MYNMKIRTGRVKRIFLLYNNYEREHANIERISEKLQSEHVRIFQGGITDKDLLKQLFMARPHIIFTFPITTCDQIAIYMMAKELFNSTIVTFTTEGVGKFHEKEIAKSFAGYYDFPPTLIDYHIFWGNYMAKYVGRELYEQHKILGRQQIRVFGNPMYENACHTFPKTEIADSKKIRVLVLTGFNISEFTKEDMMRSQDIVNIEGKSTEEILTDNTFVKYKEFIQEEKRYCDKYIRHIIDAANRNPDVLFVVKLHPQEILTKKSDPTRLQYLKKLENIKNIQMIEESVPLANLLPYVQLLVHYGSTANLEAYIYRVPTVKVELKNVENNFMPETNRLTASTYYVDIDEDNSISKFVEEIKNGKNIFQKNELTEKQLYAYMNYKDKQSYNPSAQIADFLVGNLQFHKLNLGIMEKWKYFKLFLKKIRVFF